MSRSPSTATTRTALARYGTTALVASSIPLAVLGVTSATGVLDLLPEPVLAVIAVLSLPLVVVFLLSFVGQWLPRPTPPPPLALRSPVRGRWRAMNSPATKVPSHGTHVYGQTFAIDLVHEPEPGARPTFADGGGAMRDPHDYPAFGQPVLAPVSGRVVRARGRARDHRARSNWLGYLYMVGEGAILSLRGASGPMGNHVVIEAADGGPYVAIAHLQRGSLEVTAGDRVEAGQPIGRVGNSGNSSEPHVHLHVMDRADANRALGLPFAFTDVVVGETGTADTEAQAPTVPANDEAFVAGVGATER